MAAAGNPVESDGDDSVLGALKGLGSYAFTSPINPFEAEDSKPPARSIPVHVSSADKHSGDNTTVLQEDSKPAARPVHVCVSSAAKQEDLDVPVPVASPSPKKKKKKSIVKQQELPPSPLPPPPLEEAALRRQIHPPEEYCYEVDPPVPAPYSYHHQEIAPQVFHSFDSGYDVSYYYEEDPYQQP
jgi:hypothetical protein